MRTSASPFFLITSVALVFSVACSGTSYTTQEDDGSGGSPGTGGQGDGGQGDGGQGDGGQGAGGDSSSTGGGTASGGDTASGGANTGGEPGSGGTSTSGGGTVNTGGAVGTGGIPTGGTPGSGGATVGGSPGTGGYGTGGFGTGGLGTGGGATGGSGGGVTQCPEPELTACPKVTAQAIDPCPGLEAEFEAALKSARACTADNQCTATNIVNDLCGCAQLVNDTNCTLINEAKLRRHEYFCQCAAPVCIGCFVTPGGPTCDDNSNLCAYGGGDVEVQ
jgi:hypothetical protein